MTKDVTYRCPYFNSILERAANPTRTKDIGSPIMKCPFCSRTIINDRNREYDSFNWFDKIMKRGAFLAVSIFISFIPALLIFALFTFVDFGTDPEFDEMISIVSYFFFIILFIILLEKRLQKEIKESKERLENPEYKALIHKMLGQKYYETRDD